MVEKVLDFHLAEYNQSRNEMTVYNQRIDRIILTYISAVFAIFGYFLAVKDDAGNAVAKLDALLALLQTNPNMKALALAVTILQAFLVLLVTAYTMTVYRHAKYTSTYLRARVLRLIGITHKQEFEYGVLHFDKNRNTETHITNGLRGMTGGLWYMFVLLLNIYLVAWLNRDTSHYSVTCLLLTVGSVLVNSAAVGAGAIQLKYFNDDAFDTDTLSEASERFDNVAAPQHARLPWRLFAIGSVGFVMLYAGIIILEHVHLRTANKAAAQSPESAPSLAPTRQESRPESARATVVEPLPPPIAVKPVPPATDGSSSPPVDAALMR